MKLTGYSLVALVMGVGLNGCSSDDDAAPPASGGSAGSAAGAGTGGSAGATGGAAGMGGTAGAGAGAGAAGSAGTGPEEVQAYDPDGKAVAADFSCLGVHATPPAGATKAAQLPVFAFGEFDPNGKPVTVADASVQVYQAPFTGGPDCQSGCAVAQQVSPGLYEATLPESGWFSYRVEAVGFVPTLENRVRLSSNGAPDWYNLIRRTTVQNFAQILQTTLDPSKGLMAGRIVDCQDRPVSGASLRVFDASGAELQTGSDGFVLAYFRDDGIPVTNRTTTSSQARFALANAPAGGLLRLEMRGRLPGESDAKLLSCEKNESFADTLSTGRLAPLRSDAPSDCSQP